MKGLGMLDGDLIFENGDFVIVGVAEVRRQTLAIEFGTHLGEWFLDIESGVDYDLMRGKATEEEAQAEIFRVLGKFEWIEEIKRVTVQSDYQKRVRQIEFEVDLVNGENLTMGVSSDDLR